jgi:transposase-like protein
MSKRRARYSAEFKQDAVMRMGQGGKKITALAKQLGIRRKFLYLWRDQLAAGGKAALERPRGRPPGSVSKTVPKPTPSAPPSGEYVPSPHSPHQNRAALPVSSSLYFRRVFIRKSLSPLICCTSHSTYTSLYCGEPNCGFHAKSFLVRMPCTLFIACRSWVVGSGHWERKGTA